MQLVSQHRALRADVNMPLESSCGQLSYSDRWVEILSSVSKINVFKEGVCGNYNYVHTRLGKYHGRKVAAEALAGVCLLTSTQAAFKQSHHKYNKTAGQNNVWVHLHNSVCSEKNKKQRGDKTTGSHIVRHIYRQLWRLFMFSTEHVP